MFRTHRPEQNLVMPAVTIRWLSRMVEKQILARCLGEKASSCRTAGTRTANVAA
jgi:hypothetical protein